MKMTLLSMVQKILKKQASDSVNSIGDTIESQDVADEIENTYYAYIIDVDIPEHFTLLSLEPSIDVTKPTHMRTPDNVDHFKWIKYNNGTAAAPDYKEVCYLKPEEFLQRSMSTQNTDPVLTVQDPSGAYLVVKTNKHPQYYTMFDDEHVVFDSYDSDVDDTLQASKVIAFGNYIPEFRQEDSFIPDLPAKHFPAFFAEAAAACFVYNKQQASPVDERRARRLWVRHQNNRHKADDANKTIPDFGRH